MKKLKYNRAKGDLGEKLACNYLIEKGYNIINKNYRNKLGEIDIIAKKENIIAFIEVKARSNTNYGYPYEAVNNKKQRKIIDVANSYMKYYNLRNYKFRFDIIEVYFKSRQINHIKNAFWC